MSHVLEHKHLIIRAEVNTPPQNVIEIKQWLVDIIESIGMKLAVGLEANPIAYYCNTPGNQGLTAAAILETSHCAIHVWDGIEPAIVQFDLYTCSKLDPYQIFTYFEYMKPIKIEWRFIDRENDLTILN